MTNDHSRGWNFHDGPPADRQCGARTRQGTPCKNWACKRRRRCPKHGGRSLGGIASPSLKHGWYSRYWPYTTMRLAVLQQRRLAEVVEAEMARLAAEAEREAEREARRMERERRNAPKLRATLEALFALNRTLERTETSCNVGDPMDDARTGT